jgi:hypothetical protein
MDQTLRNEAESSTAVNEIDKLDKGIEITLAPSVRNTRQIKFQQRARRRCPFSC